MNLKSLHSGRHFGSDGLSHGKFEDIKESGYGIDAGPIMICHKNGKDVVILSSFSTRSFQMLRNFDGLEETYDYHSSPMEQVTRITNDSIQFGFGESFRSTDKMKEAAETNNCPSGTNCKIKDSLKDVRSEAIIGISKSSQSLHTTIFQ